MCDDNHACDVCDAEQKSINLSEEVTNLLISNGAGNLTVFFVGAKLMVAALAVLQLPPNLYLKIVCDMYTKCTGTDIVPVQVSPIPVNTPKKDTN